MAVGVEKLRDRRAKLEAELKEIEEHEKAELDRRAVVAGHAVLAHAERDPVFQEQLNDILKTQLKKKRDRVLFDLPVKTKASTQKSIADPSSSERTSQL